MKVVVKDANIFIDLALMRISDLWFQLPYTTMTTTLVEEELEAKTDTDQIEAASRQALTYIQNELVSSISQDVFLLRMEYQKYETTQLSEADISVLYLAETEKAKLLSGDKQLRKLALKNEIEVHGTLWILQELVAAGVLNPLEHGYLTLS